MRVGGGGWGVGVCISRHKLQFVGGSLSTHCDSCGILWGFHISTVAASSLRWNEGEGTGYCLCVVR